jgi:chorismate dehydratase
VSARPLDSHFTKLFSKALGEGISRRNEAVSLLREGSVATPEEVIDYLNNNIDFNLDDRKREAISLFISYIKELNLNP